MDEKVTYRGQEVPDESVVRDLPDDSDCYRSSAVDGVDSFGMVDRHLPMMVDKNYVSAPADHAAFAAPPEPPLGIVNPNCHVEVSSHVPGAFISRVCLNSLEKMEVDCRSETDFRISCVAYPRYYSIHFEVNVYQMDKRVIVEVQRQAGDGCEFHRIYRQFINNLHQHKITDVVFSNLSTCPPLLLGPREVNVASIAAVVARNVEILKSKFAETVDEALIHLAQLSQEEIYHDVLLQQKDLVEVLLRCCSMPLDDLARLALACLGNLANCHGVTEQVLQRGGVPIIVQKCHSTVLQVQREAGRLLDRMLSVRKSGDLTSPEVRRAAESLGESTDHRIRDLGSRILISLGGVTGIKV